jgi:predicted outer membrane repeat protein
MHSSVRSSCALVLAFVLVAPAARGGGARIVDAPALPPFYSLQDAVNAATDGDTILVATGQYEPFTITNKSVSIVSVPGHVVFIDGTIRVNDLAAGRSVLLSGLEGRGKTQPNQSDPGLIVSSCQGHVRVEGCKLTGGLGGPKDFSETYGDGGHGVVLQASPQVVFSHCTLTGGTGNGNLNCYDCTGGDGGFGVRVNLSAPAFYQCTLQGGHGGSVGGQGGNGGHAVWQGNTFVFAAGSELRGGGGGRGDDFLAGVGGDGGNGLLVNATGTADLLDNTCVGGAAGTSGAGSAYNGHPGAPIGGSGTVHQHVGEARSAAANRLWLDGFDLHVTVAGVPGDKVWLRVATRPAWWFQASLPGVHLVANAPVPMAPAGVIPASGSLSVTLPITDLVGQADRLLYLQALGFDAFGDAWLGSPMHTLVLDRASPPDCNGNLQSDLVDTILGVSPDCSPNLVPDECEPDCDANGLPDACEVQTGAQLDCNENGVPDNCDIAAGLSLDCNANGVPDDCDIASGSSPDANGNGIPDECEPNFTWWVDASAPAGGNGSSAAPFQTIAEAMLPAIDGDEIVLRDGVYSGPGNREVSFGGRSVIVRSEHGPASCAIDLQGLGRAFQVDSFVGAGARIEGLTIRNGSHGTGKGGAIFVKLAPVTIRDCVFESCQVVPSNGMAKGGALYLDASPARIEDCVFIGNSAGASFNSAGGAIHSVADFLEQSDPLRILRCTFIGNTASIGGALNVESQVHLLHLTHSRFLANMAFRKGGGVAARFVSTSGGPASTIGDCLFAGNTAAENGGAVLVEAPCCVSELWVWLRNSTFAGNQAGVSGGGLAVLSTGAKVRIGNCIAWDNLAPSGAQVALQGGVSTTLLVERSNVQGGQEAVFVSSATLTWGAGNLDIDPQFADPDGPDNDPLTFGNNDYRPIAGAPVNDAGSNALVPPDANDVDGDGNTSEPTPLDLDLTPRFVEDLLAPNVGAGTPPLVDMGCYER